MSNPTMTIINRDRRVFIVEYVAHPPPQTGPQLVRRGKAHTIKASHNTHKQGARS